MSKLWELSWGNYAKYEDIMSSDRETTFLLILKKNIGHEKAESLLLESLSHGKYKITKIKNSEEPDHYKILYENKLLARLFNRNQYLVIQTFDLNVQENLLSILTSLKIFKQVIKLFHNEEKNTIKNTEILMVSRTGLNKKGEPDEFLPSTFYKFLINDRIIGKVLLEYFNYEMDSFTPTIQMIEVAKGFRGLGYGELILKEIECRLKQLGFNEIWSSDTRSEWFWEKMRYDIDIDEGYKSLTRVKC